MWDETSSKVRNYRIFEKVSGLAYPRALGGRGDLVRGSAGVRAESPWESIGSGWSEASTPKCPSSAVASLCGPTSPPLLASLCPPLTLEEMG